MAAPTMANAALFGVSALGDALNARTAANNSIALSRAQTQNLLDNIAFNNAQRADAMDWGRRQLADEIAFNATQRQQAQTYASGTLADKIALERRNLEREVQVAQANREATLSTLLENIAARQKSMGDQRALIDAEQGRQQAYARGQRDVLDANAGLFDNFGGQLNTTAGGLAETIMQAITGSQPPGVVPPTRSSTVAEREAGMRDRARTQVAGDVQRGANVNALGQLLTNIGVATGRNNQIGEILANFAKGSQATLDPALRAASMAFEAKPILQDIVPTEQYINPGPYIGPQYVSAGRFIGQNYVNNPLPAPARPLLGDLLKTGSNVFRAMNDAGMFNTRPSSGIDYSLATGNNLDLMGGGQGLRLDMPSGDGLRLGGGETGLVLRSNLGIK